MTVTVTNGNTTVTSTVALEAAPGDLFVLGTECAPVAAVPSATTLTLQYGWPGSSASGRSDFGVIKAGAYWRDSLNVLMKVNELLSKVSLGLPRSLDAAGTLASRSAYNGMSAGFLFLAVDVVPASLYVKTGPGATDWSRGISIEADTTPAAGSVPVNTAIPTIAGTPSVGQTLTATYGSWSNSPTSYSGQWQRNGVPIDGALSLARVVVSADRGTTLTFRSTAANAHGIGTSVVSAGVAIPATQTVSPGVGTSGPPTFSYTTDGPRAPNHGGFGLYNPGTGIPPGWTEAMVLGATWEVVEDSNTLNGKRLRHYAETAARRCLILNAAGQSRDFDIVARCRFGSACNVAIRARITDATGGSEDCLSCTIALNSASLAQIVNGSLSNLATNASLTLAETTWYWIRFRAVGNDVRARIWGGTAADEPGTWTMTGTATGTAAPGQMGIGSSVTPDGASFDWFDYGTGNAIAGISSTSLTRVNGTHDTGTISEQKSWTQNPTTTTPTLFVYGRNQPADDFGPVNWWQCDFLAANVMGKTPVFQVHLVDANGQSQLHDNGGVSGIPAPVSGWTWKPWYSYDRVTWHRFANSSHIGGPTSNPHYVQFSHSAAFTGKDVFVRVTGPGYPLGLATARVAGLADHKRVFQTASWDAVDPTGANRFRVAETAAFVADDSRTIPPQPLYGFKIADPDQAPTSGTKRKVLLTSGVHPCEHEGPFCLWGAIDFILGGSETAELILKEFDFYVYPLTNPGGWRAGYWRQGDNSGRDCNRHWNNNFIDFCAKLRPRITADLGGSCSASIDFHGIALLRSEAGYIDVRDYTGTGTIGGAWENAIIAAYADMGLTWTGEITLWEFTSDNSSPPGSTHGWARAYLGPIMSYTSEYGPLRVDSPERYADYGEAQMRALLKLYQAGRL